MTPEENRLTRLAQLLRYPDCDPNEIAPLLHAILSSFEEEISEQISRSIMEIVPLPLLFSKLYINDEITRLICIVIEKLLQPFSYIDIAEGDMKPFLEQGLQSELTPVRLLSIKQLTKCMIRGDLISKMANSELFELVLDSLSADDIQVSSTATKFLTEIASNALGLTALFRERNVDLLYSLLRRNDTVKLRIYELVVQLASTSPEALDLIKSSGLLDAMYEDYKTEDLLLKMNIIELYSQLSSTSNGFCLLEQAGIIQEFVRILQDESNSFSVTLAKCATLKFFGKLVDYKDLQFDNIVQKYDLFSLLAQAVNESNVELKTTAINVIGNIGNDPLGLVLLDNSSPDLLALIANIYKTSIGDVRLACLQSLSSCLHASENPSMQLSEIAGKLYRSFSTVATNSNQTKALLSELIVYAKQSLEELKVSAFSVMQGMAFHPNLTQEMGQSKSFVEFILDRRTESTHIGKTWKFAIAQTLITVPDAATLLGTHTFNRLQQFVRQGPFYMPTENAIAFESV
ncbi:uncharacterized protein VTP21DRAFT_8391 [Calcarisporiella thermophila]|uniref:uncharacterized protein n=1 Tax=Calcarisporiella thermophila TaxID=911321 RepID=UPI00374436E5